MLIQSIGENRYALLSESLAEYSEMMSKLGEPSCKTVFCAPVEDRICGIGQNLLLLAYQSVSTERREVESLLQQMIHLPLISLLVLLGLMIFIILFIRQKVIRPLARITFESEAVAQGTSRRITPYGDGQNEIHHLVAAINGMMTELERRQEQLIQSRKIAAIGTLTAGIAHEINNPVNNLSLILESLLEDTDDMGSQERRARTRRPWTKRIGSVKSSRTFLSLPGLVNRELKTSIWWRPLKIAFAC